MFYSHQLLARKAPLGQIWMAATMHAKMNRRKLDQIDIIRICEEILNPSVPMALRLSGILMGGVVIVYERKVRLLYDDVNRLLVEINSAWKVKPAVDPTVLPKGKVQAKFNAVTLPENQSADFGDVEPSIDISAKYTTMGFQQNGYFAMRLDTIDELTESYMESLKEKEPNNQHHQADADNITLDDNMGSFQAGPASFNRYERFDIEGDEETQYYFPSQEHAQKPPTPLHSPPPEMQPQRDDILEPEGGKHSHQSSAEQGDAEQRARKELQKQRFVRKRARRQPPFIMDDEQTMVPSNIYQSWLQDTTDIWGRRPKIGARVSPKTSMKLSKLIELPPVALACGLVGKDMSIYYPPPLLQQWIRSIQPHHDSPSGKSTSPRAPAPSSSSSQEQTLSRQQFQDPPEFPLAGFGIGDPTERLRNNLMNFNEGIAPEFNLSNERKGSGSTGAEMRSLSIPSPGPGLDYISNTSDSNSGQFSKKRPSSSRFQGSGLGPVDEEEEQWIHERAENDLSLLGEQQERNFKLPRFSRHGPTPDQELLVETGTNTQTQHHAIDEEAEMMTNNIRTHLKTYFETPGAPETESLNQLAFGLNKKQAAQLFYQICVLATRDVLKVQQNLAYGDITICRGAKM